MRNLMKIAQKRVVQVILDIECYEDFDPHDMNWEELLELEGGERVSVKVKDYSDLY